MMFTYYPSPLAHSALYERHKDMDFAAAHLIPSTIAGKSQFLHGHTYFCDITVIGSDLDQAGMLVNFEHVKELIHGRYDHSYLNKQPEYTFSQEGAPNLFPTTEIVSRNVQLLVQAYLDHLEHRPFCAQVILRESPSSYVVYRAPLPERWKI